MIVMHMSSQPQVLTLYIVAEIERERAEFQRQYDRMPLEVKCLLVCKFVTKKEGAKDFIDAFIRSKRKDFLYSKTPYTSRLRLSRSLSSQPAQTVSTIIPAHTALSFIPNTPPRPHSKSLKIKSYRSYQGSNQGFKYFLKPF